MAASSVIISVEEMVILGVPKSKAEQTVKNKSICGLLRLLVDKVYFLSRSLLSVLHCKVATIQSECPTLVNRILNVQLSDRPNITALSLRQAISLIGCVEELGEARGKLLFELSQKLKFQTNIK